MYPHRVVARGFRAAADEEMVCEALAEANNAGTTTVTHMLYLAHPRSFPRISRHTVATPAAAASRQIDIRYAFDTSAGADEGPVGRMLQHMALPALFETRQLIRNLGRVRATTQPLVDPAPKGQPSALTYRRRTGPSSHQATLARRMAPDSRERPSRENSGQRRAAR